MSKETGGPAFPWVEVITLFETDSSNCMIGHEVEKKVHHPGNVTLRDYFAAHASDGDIYKAQEWRLIEGSHFIKEPKYTRAEARYIHADAMLKERSK